MGVPRPSAPPVGDHAGHGVTDRGEPVAAQSEDEPGWLASQTQDAVAVPSTADPALKAKVYAELDIEVIHQPGQAQALVSARAVPSVSEDSAAQAHTAHCRLVA